MTLTTDRIRRLYTFAVAWQAQDSESGPDLSGLRASNAAEFDEWLSEHDAALVSGITMRVRQNCTPSREAYERGGDFLVEAVADWIDDPPEWVDAPWRVSAHQHAAGEE